MGKKALLVMVILAAAVLVCSGWNLCHYLSEQYQHKSEIEALRTYAEETTDLDSRNTGRKDIAQLRRLNCDCAGWISISDTSLDFPLMHTPLDSEYYLKRNFNGEDSPYGVPFLDARCTLSSDNLIIYGHHMSDGSMFSVLHEYRNKDFAETHPTILLETINGASEYEIFAVIQASGSFQEDSWSIYNQISFDTDNWEETLSQLTKRRLYDTGVTPKPGNQLLTLSTCEYSQDNGRLVVVAVKIS